MCMFVAFVVLPRLMAPCLDLLVRAWRARTWLDVHACSFLQGCVEVYFGELSWLCESRYLYQFCGGFKVELVCLSYCLLCYCHFR